MMPNVPEALGWILAGLGAMAAGLGILKAGIAIGRNADKVFSAFASQAQSQLRIAEANERQARALEQSGRLIPLLESLHEDREQISTTLRVISRELHELREYIEILRPDSSGAG